MAPLRRAKERAKANAESQEDAEPDSKREPPPDSKREPEPDSKREPEPVSQREAEPVSEREPEPSSTREPEPRKGDRAVVTIGDPRLEALEPLLASAKWSEICAQLGPADQAGKLPPTLGLVYALARSESAAASDKGASAAHEMSIRCMAALFSVPAGSPIALVLAKRLLRKNPAAWRTKPAPKTSVSILIMVIALLIGAAIAAYFNRGALGIRI